MLFLTPSGSMAPGYTWRIDNDVAGDILDLRLEASHAEVSKARRQASEFLRRLDVEPSLVADTELVVAELLANAADQPAAGPIDFLLVAADDALHVTVVNSRPPGPPVVFPSEPIGDALVDGGRGLNIVQAITDGMWIHGTDDTTAVTCWLRRRLRR